MCAQKTARRRRGSVCARAPSGSRIAEWSTNGWRGRRAGGGATARLWHVFCARIRSRRALENPQAAYICVILISCFVLILCWLMLCVYSEVWTQRKQISICFFWIRHTHFCSLKICLRIQNKYEVLYSLFKSSIITTQCVYHLCVFIISHTQLVRTSYVSKSNFKRYSCCMSLLMNIPNYFCYWLLVMFWGFSFNS